MPEVHEGWSSERIQERLRLLTQRRAAAVRERDRIGGGIGGAVPSAPGGAVARAVGEPSPAARAAWIGPGEDPEPAWRADSRSDLSADDLRAALEAPRREPAGESDDLAELAVRLGDLIGPGPATADRVGDTEERAGMPDRGAEPPLPPLFVTAHGSDTAAPASPRERAERLAEVEAEIEQLEQGIAEVRRILARRYANEGAAKFEQLRVRLESLVPAGEEAQRTFSADRFVEGNRADLQTARSLAAGFGRLFPDRALDFRGLPRAMRERLFRKIADL